MKKEILRQLVHAGGLAFVILAQFLDKTAIGTLSLMISFSFAIYSGYIIKCEKNHRTLLSSLECRLRDFALSLERKDSERPFIGAFWFYLGLGLALIIFPLPAASAAGASLAVSDCLSTLIGIRFGRRRLAGRKTLEGTAAFFVSSVLVCLLFVNPLAALIGAIAATLAELLPESRAFSFRGRRVLDDNLLIPLIAGAALSIALML